MDDGSVKITCNARLLLDAEDFSALEGLLRQGQQAYDACAEYLKENEVPLDIKSAHDAVYSWMRERFLLLSSQMVIKTYKDALAALRSIKSNKEENAKTPEKKGLSMRLDKRLYTNFTVDGIYLTGFIPRKRKFVAIQGYGRLWEMFARYTTSDPLVFIRDGEAWLSIPFNVPAQPVLSDTVLGIDLGMRRFVTTSDGVVIDDKEYKARRRRVRYLKSELKKKGTKSAKRHLKKLKNKERRQSKDFLNRMANAVIASTDAGTIAVEDLKKIKKNTAKTKDGFKRKRHNRAFSQVALSEFVAILTYKAPQHGKAVATVSPTWTSQTDSRTGRRDGVRRGRRYICSDGTVLDADWNAAINIAVRSEHPVSKRVTPVDGGLRFFLAGRHGSTCRTQGRQRLPRKPLTL